MLAMQRIMPRPMSAGNVLGQQRRNREFLSADASCAFCPDVR
jgi:hypothetical protein